MTWTAVEIAWTLKTIENKARKKFNASDYHIFVFLFLFGS